MPCHAYISTVDSQEKIILLDSFISSNFNYHFDFYSDALSQKIDKIPEHALGLLYNESYSDYCSLLLKTERPTMEVSRLRRLAIEVFKTLKSLNPDFMHTHFKKGSHSARRKEDLVVNRAKTITFG